LSGWRQAADLYQFETECFQLGQDPVEGSLIGEKARQDGVAALGPGTQGLATGRRRAMSVTGGRVTRRHPDGVIRSGELPTIAAVPRGLRAGVRGD